MTHVLEETPPKPLRRSSLSDVALETLAIMHDENCILTERIPAWFEAANLARMYEFQMLPNYGKRAEKTPFILQQRNIDAVVKAGLIEPLPLEDHRRFLNAKDGPYTRLFSITETGRQMLEASRQRLLRIQEDRVASYDQGRLVAIVNCDNFGMPAPGVSALCRVIRETPKRLYVTLLMNDRAWRNEKDDIANSSHPLLKGTELKGTETPRFVERQHVACDITSVAHYEQIRNATEDYREARMRANAQMEEEISQIRRRYDDRWKQSLAQLKDAYRPPEEDAAPSLSGNRPKR
jgi:hypothetical protein